MNLQGYNEYFGGFDSWRSGCRRPAAATQGPKHRRTYFSDGTKVELNVQRWNPDVDQSERSYYYNAICFSFTQCIFSIWRKKKKKVIYVTFSELQVFSLQFCFYNAQFRVYQNSEEKNLRGNFGIATNQVRIAGYKLVVVIN